MRKVAAFARQLKLSLYSIIRARWRAADLLILSQEESKTTRIGFEEELRWQALRKQLAILMSPPVIKRLSPPLGKSFWNMSGLTALRHPGSSNWATQARGPHWQRPHHQ